MKRWMSRIDNSLKAFGIALAFGMLAYGTIHLLFRAARWLGLN